MSEGRTVLVDGNELGGNEPQGGKKASRLGGDRRQELKLGDNNVRIVIVRGAYQNRIYSSDSGVMEVRVEPYFRYSRHPIPPPFQRPDVRQKNVSKLTGKAKFLYVPCTRGPDPNNPQACHLCGIAAPQLSAKDRNCFTVLHIHPYHLRPSDNDPNVKWPTMCLSHIPGLECPGCKAGYETVGAGRRYIDVTDTDKQVLVEYANFISDLCQCGGQLGTESLMCSRCGRVLMAFSQTSADEFQKAMSMDRMFCQQCGTQVRLTKVKRCVNKCEPPVPQSIFKMVLTIRKSKQAGKSWSQIAVMNKEPAGDLLTRYENLAVPLDLPAILAGSVKEQKETVFIGGGGGGGMSESR